MTRTAGAAGWKVALLAALALAGVAAECRPASTGAGDQVPLETEEQKTAYALGYRLGQNIKPLAFDDAELAAVSAGVADAAGGREARLDVATYEGGVQELAQKRTAVAAAERKASEADFLAKAAAEEGAQVFDSGLIFIPEHEGEGESPGPRDRVQVHYHGTFPDGTVFDSSVQRGQPAVFPVNGVIPCWTEAIQKLKVGGRARIVCPPDTAYGDRGAPPRIPPGATLVFEVQLLGIQDQG